MAMLKGLSEKLLKSHHENNYGGAVKNLGLVKAQLAKTTKDTPVFVIGGLKERCPSIPPPPHSNAS